MISQSTLFNQYRSHEETTRLDTKMYETIQRMAMENNGLSSTSPSALLLRARRSGKCPVSLIHDISLHGTISYSGGFDEAVLRIIDDDVVNSASGGFGLRSDISVGKEFLNILKMAESINSIPGDYDLQRKTQILEQRRCILLAIPGSTAPSNPALKYILANGYLVMVKSWLDDIRNKSVGGVDLLLHLLMNIIKLPVTKEMVSSSKLGKTVVSVEKDKICVGGAKENVIKERIAELKQEWSASVKRFKNGKAKAAADSIKKGSSTKPIPPLKRSRDATSNGVSGKRIKTERNLLSTSKLIRKAALTGSEPVRSSSNISTKKHVDCEGNPLSAAETARLRAQERLQKEKARIALLNPDVSVKEENNGSGGVAEKNVNNVSKKVNNISWADKFGGQLIEYYDRETTEEERHLLDVTEEERKSSSVSWSDRKKRERMREKEMMDKARKLTGPGDGQARLDAMGISNPPLTQWHKPQPLSSADTPQVHVVSNEVAVQVTRMSSVTPFVLSIDDNIVPNNPTPLSDIEQALDLTSQVSSTPAIIPFFTPQKQEDVLTAAVSAVQAPQPTQQQLPQQLQQEQPQNTYSTTMSVGQLTRSQATSVPPAPSPHNLLGSVFQQGASVEMVQALGLPTFLAGQNLQVLQKLAANPNLLKTFVDSNGMYNQVSLLGLVQTLAQDISPTQTTSGQMTGQNTHQTQYMNQTYTATKQQYSLSGLGFAGSPGYNAHVSPPPPSVPFQQTQQQQSSYVAPPQSNHNNSRSQNRQHGSKGRGGYRGDQNGSEGNLHLSGYGPTTTTAEIMTMFAPYVNVAEVVTKNGFSFVNTRDPDGARRAREALNGAHLGGQPVRINFATRKAVDPSHNEKGRNNRDTRKGSVSLPINSLGQIEYDKVKDDRGNPSTKNLFVAGYGPGTTEQQLRDVFGQHSKVTGVVMKSSFAFINTTDKVSAVQARESLTGSIINGGMLRINFAKESGRLGTSFDTTYGPGSGSHSRYMRNVR